MKDFPKCNPPKSDSSAESRNDDVEVDSFNIPVGVKHYPIVERKHQVFSFLCRLDKKDAVNEKTLICKLCMDSLRDTVTYKDTYKKYTLKDTKNTTNLLKHFNTKHGDVDVVKNMVESLSRVSSRSSCQQKGKASNEASTVSKHSFGVTSGYKAEEGIQRYFKSRVEAFKDTIYQFLVFKGLPHHITECKEFKSICQIAFPGYTNMSRDTFNKRLMKDLQIHSDVIAGMLKETSQFILGETFISMIHDMYTGIANKNYLGVSVAFIHQFRLYRLAVYLGENSTSHKADYNATIIENQLLKRYQFDFAKHCHSVVSDTTNSAVAVAAHLDEDIVQENCEMHQLNSCLKVAYGMIENTRTKALKDAEGKFIVDDDGKKIKVRSVVTPGGAFPDGNILVKKLRNLAVFFDTPQRKKRFNDIQKRYNLPIGQPKLPNVTRITGTFTLFQECLYHYYAFQKFAGDIKHDMDVAGTQKHEDSGFLEIMHGIVDVEWRGIQEMEGMTKFFAAYATTEAQMDDVMPAWIIYLRKKCQHILMQTSFKCLAYSNRPKSTTTFVEFVKTRTEEITLDMMTSYGKKCWA